MPHEVSPILWHGDSLELLDQRQLPQVETYVRLQDCGAVAQAITDMVVRGAPAIAITAAYGLVLAAKKIGEGPISLDTLAGDFGRLAASRPTAVNLHWALEQMRQVVRQGGDVTARLEDAAIAMHREDRAINQRIGDWGATLLPPQSAVYTHCNTGALATGGYGTALGVIRSAHRQGKITQVYAGETRPWLQGARLTAWDLMREQIPVNLVVEGASGQLLRRGEVSWVIVGADRVAANGDLANKIGTYNLAVLARHHGVRFMAAVPVSTIDLGISRGEEIPIEERDPMEVTHLAGRAIAPPGAQAINPAFDVTPADLIDAIVTEFGVIERPDVSKLAAHLQAFVPGLVRRKP
jgi:methylthioribose-1-phosphate isomerase